MKNCTSTLKVTKHQDETVTVDACLTHYGHSKDLQHTWISNSARQKIACKLKDGVTAERILDDVRDEPIEESLSRCHILKLKDIQNISRSYGINEIIRHNNDQMSVLSWIRSYENTDNNPVLFYKMQGSKHSNPLFEEKDFMVVIQTESQKELLQKFGDNGVCCDSTHKTTGYKFLLSTILVIDEVGKGQPTGWCLSNKETIEFLEVFFGAIKQNIGQSLNPRWFMSDLANQFYKAFSAVFGCDPKWLYCIWHVDKNWQEEIRSKIKGSSQEEKQTIQSSVYQMAKMVMQCTNEVEFDDKLENFVSRLNTEKTSEFRAYFLKEYVPTKRRWGYCYRVGDCINTNMFVESFHRTLKYKYLKGKYNKRVDVCLVNLIKLARDKVFERITDLVKGVTGYRSRKIHERHSTSLLMDTSLVNENVNQATNSYSIRDYTTTKLADVCPVRECSLRCTECGICSHTFHCTCPDFMVNHLGCKHMHLLKRFLDDGPSGPEEVITEDLPIQDHKSYIENEVAEAFQTVRASTKEQSCSKARQTSINLLTCLSTRVNGCNDTEALDQLNRQLKSALNTFDACIKFKSVQNINLLKSPPGNKNIEKQPNFYSTAKKRKAKNKVRFARPTSEELKDFFQLKPWEDQTSNPDNGRDEVPSTQITSTSQTSNPDNGRDEVPSTQITSTTQKKGKVAKRQKKARDTSKIQSSTSRKEGSSKTKKNATKLSKVQKIVLGYFGVDDLKTLPVSSDRILIDEQHPPNEIILLSEDDIKSIKDLLSADAWIKVLKKVVDLSESWSCPICETSQYIGMIECDLCNVWYHMDCVKLQQEEEYWVCEKCPSLRKRPRK